MPLPVGDPSIAPLSELLPDPLAYCRRAETCAGAPDEPQAATVIAATAAAGDKMQTLVKLITRASSRFGSIAVRGVGGGLPLAAAVGQNDLQTSPHGANR